MRPSRIITDYGLSPKGSISAGEMYSAICVHCVVDQFDLRLTQIDPLLTKICAKNYVYIFVPRDLNFDF